MDRAVRCASEEQVELERAADLYNLNEGDFSDDELDSASPLLDLYIQDSGGRGVVKTMIAFNFWNSKHFGIRLVLISWQE